MPDQAFQRTPIYPLEKPICDDLNQDSSQADRSLRDFLGTIFASASGFLNTGLDVVQQSPPALGVLIKAGLAFQNAPTDTPTNIGGILGLNDLSPYKPIVLTADYHVAVPAPPGSNSRIDLIEVAYTRRLDNPQSRNFLNTTSGAFAPASVAKTLDFTVDGTLAYYAATDTPTTALAYKSGVSGVSPTAPAVDTGYMAIAHVHVTSGAVTIVTGDITDERVLLAIASAATPVKKGALLNIQILPGFSGTYTPTPGTTSVRAQIQAAGGGAGGVTAGAGSVSASGGGGGGEYVEVYIDGGSTLITGGAYAVGNAGTGGGPSSAGVAGGNSTIVINGVTYTATGGGGSNPSINGGGVVLSIGRGGTSTSQVGSLPGILRACGQPGLPGMAFIIGGDSDGVGGNGGGSPFGYGGQGTDLTQTNGSLSSGSGSGGHGVCVSNGTASGRGGNSGMIVVEEYA